MNAPFPELTVGPAVMLASEVTKLRVLVADRENETQPTLKFLKDLVLARHEQSMVDWLASNERDQPDAMAALERAIGAPHLEALQSLRAGEWAAAVSDVDLMRRLWKQVDARGDLVMLLVDLSLFRPWAQGRLDFQRSRAESELNKALKNLGVAGGDTDTLKVYRSEIEETHRVIEGTFAPEFGSLHKVLEKSAEFMQRPGNRRMVVGLGVAAGALTGGLAAPAIGAAVAPAGLAGAAATSAGLAALGGGSLAAGGYGMLGGTILIQASAAGLMGLGAFELGRVSVRVDQSKVWDMPADTYAAEFSQLLVTVDRFLVNAAGGTDAIARIRRTLAEMHSSHAREKERLGSAADSEKYGMGRKVKLLEKTIDRLDEISDRGKSGAA